jgi:YceI-like domain
VTAFAVNASVAVNGTFGAGTGSGEVHGTMVFDRKDYGMNKGIHFVRIGDSVDVTVDLKAKRISGPPVVVNQ